MQAIALRISTWLAGTAICALMPTAALAHGSQAPPIPSDYVFAHDFMSPTPSTGNPFGASVAAGGPYVAAGAPSSGEVHIFDRTTGDWVRTLQSPNPSPSSLFGTAVAMSGLRVLVGAPLDDTAGTDAGAVYLFDAFTGALLKTFLNPTPAAGDDFGKAVAFVFVGGTRFAIGAPGDDTQGTNAGAVYVFDRGTDSQPNGVLTATLLKPAPIGTSAFGSTVAAVGQNTAVGDPSHGAGAAEAGAVFVYDTSFFSPTYGQLLLTRTNPSPAPSANFGTAITTAGSVAGTLLVVGAPAFASGTLAGRVDVFIASSGAFVRSIVSPTSTPGDWFGYSLASLGTMVIAGAPKDDTGSTDSGTAYFFNPASGQSLGAFGNPTPDAQDWFAYALATSCIAIAAGAPQDGASGPLTGAAYLYLPELPSCTVAGTPAEIGEWGPVGPMPAVATHLTVLGNQEALFWFGQSHPAPTYVFDPSTEMSSASGAAERDVFCSGHTTLADGRVMSIGGHALLTLSNGIPDTYIHDPQTGDVTRVADMAKARWYPTATALRDGRILATSGWATSTDYATIPEIYSVATNTWTPLTGANLQLPLYPFMFLLPNGKLFQAGADGGDNVTRTLDLVAQSWATVGNSRFTQGSAAMYRPGKVVKAGGRNLANTATVADADVIDMTVETPAWRPVGSMAFPRQNHNLVLLPDGNALAVGGRVNDDMPMLSQLTAERFDPDTETWTTMACMDEPRMYHSTAALLPDGRVLSAGGNCYPTYQIYSPPYLFNGPRPTITSAPDVWLYETNFFIETPDDASIESVVLLRPSSVTHAFDQNQRYVPLFFVPLAGVLQVWAPATRDEAPPGDYLLFLVNSSGVPSLAKTIRLDGPEGCG